MNIPFTNQLTVCNISNIFAISSLNNTHFASNPLDAARIDPKLPSVSARCYSNMNINKDCVNSNYNVDAFCDCHTNSDFHTKRNLEAAFNDAQSTANIWPLTVSR
jgi:hypothetical protein